MPEAEISFLKECLKHIKKSSIVSIVISFITNSYLEVIGNSKSKFFVINYPPNKLLLSDKEMFILERLNGYNSLSGITAMLSLQYHEDKKRSYKLILQFLNYLINNNIPLKIQY